MGLDHGVWTVLKFLRPMTDVPVFQMSLDYTKPPSFHYQLRQELKLSIPTSDHYLPMLYALGLLDKDEATIHFYEGYQHGGISMRCFQGG